MAGLLRQYTPAYVAGHRRQAAPQVQSTLAKLSLCRTAALGGRRYRCGSCDRECTVYNSCGDRHFPQCSGAKRADWMTSAAQLLLPGIDYFQVVFTIPDQLSSLALGNRREIYDLLFRSAWRALREVIEEEQAFEASAVMVLHTWNQKLEPHAHVHAIVPGGGPSLTGERRWVPAQRRGRSSRHRRRRRSRPRGNRPYLVAADELRQRFRKVFLDGLRRLHRKRCLKLDGDWSHLRNRSAFETWLKPLEHVTWVTYIEPPPSENSSPEHVLKYLARYLTGGPISDRRLISHQRGGVTFRARTGTTPGGGHAETQAYTLSETEFVRRWSLHILPKGYVKTRRFGGYSNRHRKRYIAECRDLLLADSVDPLDDPSNPCESPASELTDERRCPKCGELMRCIATTDRSSWSVVMSGPTRPIWYDDG